MSEPTGLGPDDETMRLIRELFSGRVCVRCGAPAARLKGGQFYCPEHAVHGTGGEQTHRVYPHPSA